MPDPINKINGKKKVLGAKQRALLEIILTTYWYLGAFQPQYSYPISLVRVIPTSNIFVRYLLSAAYTGSMDCHSNLTTHLLLKLEHI